MSDADEPGDEPSFVAAGGTGRQTKPWLLLGLIGVALFLYVQFGQLISIASLADRESQLRAFQADHPYLVYGVALGVYVLVTGLSLPGAAALSLVYAWYFGFWRAVPLVSFASTIGATAAFLSSRFLLRDYVQGRFGDKLATFNARLAKEGAFYLFTLRLIPAIPFFVINLVMGLTPLRVWTFWWVSQLGMLPGTIVYVYAGSRVPDLNQLAVHGAGAVFSSAQLFQITIAFALLGLFPWLVKKVLQWHL